MKGNEKCAYVAGDMGNEYGNDEVFPLSKDYPTPVICRFRWFEQWKVDLAKLPTEDFQRRFYSKEDEVLAEDEVIFWRRGTVELRRRKNFF